MLLTVEHMAMFVVKSIYSHNNGHFVDLLINLSSLSQTSVSNKSIAQACLRTQCSVHFMR